MFCINCGNALLDGAKFCNKCGTRVESSEKCACPNCGAKLVEGASFCTQCGAKIAESRAMNTTAGENVVVPQTVEDAEYNYKRGKECFGGQIFDTAFKYFQEAATQGHVEAQYQLAEMYEYGVGVPESRKHATKWYAMAAENGHAIAQYELYIRYGYEEAGFAKVDVNVDENDEEAMREVLKRKKEIGKEAEKWLRLSANQGFADALCSLGEHYEKGDDFTGVVQDVDKAKELYMKAISKGSQNAILNLATLEFRLQLEKINQVNDQKALMDAITDFFQKILPLFEENQVIGNQVYIIGVSPDFEKEMKGAMTYAKLAKNEIPLILNGITLLGKSTGALFTTHAVYYKNSAKDQGNFLYNDIQNISFEYGAFTDNYYIKVNGKKIGYSFKYKAANAYKDVLTRLIDLFNYSHNMENGTNVS